MSVIVTLYIIDNFKRHKLSEILTRSINYDEIVHNLIGKLN